MSEDYTQRIPVYAMAPFKVMGLSTDALMITMLGTAIFQPVIGGYSLILFYLMGLLIDRQVAKAGIPGGFVQYKLAIFSVSPFARRYLPFLEKLTTRVWRAQGCLPPPRPTTRYVR